MIRYAVVGAGWISQEAFMPAVATTGNSRMQAIVSGSPDAARKLADFHGVPEVVSYADYDALLASDRIDAVYVALPNSMHADFAIRALRAGKHVMVEKPLATTLAESDAMIAAAKASGAYLMTAYRLHNEPGTHAMINAVRQGQIGDPVYFAATFGFQTRLGNHRLKAGHWGGALPDVGVYCLNAARHVFAAEPLAVQAMASRPATDPRFAEIDASLAVTLRFPGDRLAQFFCSFGSAETETIRIVGSRAELILDPAFKFDSVLQMTIRTPGNEQRQTFRQVDHFAGQIACFSDCIAQGVPPEADGGEGLADMRALLAIDEAARTGETVRLDPRPFGRGIDAGMVRHFPVTDRRLLV
ncbi:MAG: Gfo/Idh/MocA family oxidoreductase [Tabrizicola sp.]|uniref:Gfo/Idh/MocA family protein n=1 Tax=Tabrizicola sp. TaxID=2005166 RepID=UPI002732E927|nr:Gfo/Idh/MocA family oxidoreductase [Tabrizicola sp.]MDP3262109.1 Gfo/Idh/MocA family oxidoreductase [Tabrizicola sp.]MDP3648145.1 Gfo/Idh/MocA family oxidoreductase [Paracoccaceae bacterium]MDZ4069693.1 Gfo/Idh/MocA family oxidoreductase [Tabrizicola sp.]